MIQYVQHIHCTVSLMVMERRADPGPRPCPDQCGSAEYCTVLELRVGFQVDNAVTEELKVHRCFDVVQQVLEISLSRQFVCAVSLVWPEGVCQMVLIQIA